MSDTRTFALTLLIVAAAGLGSLLAGRLAERARIPSPALLLAVTAGLVAAITPLHSPSDRIVERIVTVALVAILFDGGAGIGMARLRAAAGPVVSAGLAGTVLTAAGGAVAVHLITGVSWYLSLLVATAVAPTDPAVVFSVLGRRRVEGLAGTTLEGESGANDPVGIALLAALLGAHHLTAGSLVGVVGTFALQLGVGLAVGIGGGLGLLWLARRVRLPAEGLYPLRTLAGALALYGVAGVAHGSGFLAVFIAGIILGDARIPFRGDVLRFHDALAGLAEAVAFVVLGLTVDLGVIARLDVWLPGLAIWLAGTVLVRPLAVGPCLLPWRMPKRERSFVLFAGLKGAVPILLGTSLLAAHVAHDRRLYGIVVVVVVASVVVQGGLVPTAARVLRLRTSLVDPAPWQVGVRLTEQPQGVHRLTVAAGSRAADRPIAGLPELPTGAWVTMVVRRGGLIAARGDTVLEAGDDVVVMADPGDGPALARLFSHH